MTPITFLTFIICSHAQITKDTLTAHQNFAKGDTLLKQRSYNQSILLFEKAAIEFKEQSIWKRHVQSLNKIAHNHYRLRNFDSVINISKEVIDISRKKIGEESLEEMNALMRLGNTFRKKDDYYQALSFYKKALSIAEKQLDPYTIRLANIYNTAGICYDDLGLLEEAQHYYTLSLKINQHLYDEEKNNNLSSVCLNQAILYANLGLYRQSFTYLKKAIALDIENYGEKHPYVAGDYYNLATSYSYVGEDDLALQYYQKGLNILKEIYKKEDEFFAESYSGIATQYTRLGKEGLGLDYYQKAINIYKDIYGENHRSTAEVMLNIGGTYRIKKEYDTALEYLRKGEQVFLSIFGENHGDMVWPNKELAELYEQQDNLDQAYLYYQKNIDISLQSFGAKNQKTAEAYINKARILLSKQQYHQSIQEYHNAIIAGTKQFKNLSVEASPEPNDYFNSNTLLTAVYGKAKALKLQSEITKNDNELFLAYNNLFLCDSLIDQTRNVFKSEEDKASLAKIAVKVYRDGISSALSLYNKTKSVRYLNNAFYFSEKNKARLLDEQLRKIKATKFAGISEDKLNQIQEISQKLETYISKFQEYQIQENTEKNTLKRDSYQDLVFTYNRKKDSLFDEIENRYPEYHQLKYDNTIVSVSKIQQKIPENTLLLEYFIGDNQLYAFAISKNKFSVVPLQFSGLDQKVLQFRKAVINKDIDTYSRMGYELYTSLLNPIISSDFDHENIIIVPDGVLWHLNFDVLLTEKSSSTNPIDLPFVIKKHTISYANAANLFFKDSFMNRDNNIRNQCLAFSFSDTANLKSTGDELALNTFRNSKDDLPGARQEIKAISEIVDGSYFYGKQAIESNFKSKANQFSMLHLALHGELDDLQPENSKLYFTQVENSEQDNYLYNREIYSMNIPAELAVLSACNTGTGKISKGEGVMSLGRAFRYAGTKSLVLTNWEVSDETTPEIMKNFYANLKKGMNKSKALQQAKLQFLNESNVYNSDPYYWGGFYLIGDTTPIKFDNKNRLYWMILVTILLIITGFWYYKRKQGSSV
ncbi:CHAT domain-containing protein [Aquimarina sp. 2201CG14-23]|uniref:CHAT domain-containing protein n=1 Tax=Aquimarina mycalae TaxID=3040073 RepID=UPI002477D419|nr:CHAT domain-containing protein [Aquimarina sp. 2201CG14-23]MDH7447668.1 CHAT domain-containing protein [Aquimarina sp. 2201CG14-23]